MKRDIVDRLLPEDEERYCRTGCCPKMKSDIADQAAAQKQRPETINEDIK